MLLIIRCLLLIIMVVFSFYPARAAKNEGKIRLEVFPDRADCLYQLGDTAVFSVNIANPGRTSRPFLLRYAFSEDKARRLEHGELQTTGGSIKLTHGMERPGFLRLDLLLIAGADTLKQASACGFDPQALRPTNILPPDFERFWRQGQAELLRVPIDASLKQVPEQEVAGAKRYLVSLACIEGSRMFGWLTVPEGRGPFPAVVHIMGAPGGIHEYRTDPGSGYARAGMIILALNIHGIELGLDQEVYEQYQARNLLGGFPFSGCDDPYRYYYRRVVLGGIRAMDYLCSREDADTTRLAVAGDSQGGGLSLLVAALDKRVKALTVNVPAMCDHTGVLYSRPTGWPHLLERENGERVRRTSAYFDGALAAGFIEVPTLMTVSLLDESCPPTTVYAAYNNLKGPRWIYRYPGVDHPGSFTQERSQCLIKWLKDTLDSQEKQK